MRLTNKGWMILYGILSGIAIYYIRKCTRMQDEIDELKDLIEMSVEVANHVVESDC